MLRIIRERFHQGSRTTSFPKGEPPALAARFRGLPTLDPSRCLDGCPGCVNACPTRALSNASGKDLQLDLGKCLFCGECVAACKNDVITF
ncbi:MAG TPA: 4Fe-4S binding protein, partial [Spirochaetia bacterium]|nr:4Fe-4S binding protein [Spirochaetia bacterium]